MVLMNLFAGQERRHRQREPACGHSGGRRGRDNLRVAAQCSLTPEGRMGVGRAGEGPEGGDPRVLMAHSCCRAENNTPL